MKTHLADWYKVLDLEFHESESEFEKRNLVINDMRKLVLDGNNLQNLIACVVCVAGGIELIGADNTFIQDIIACHQSHLMSFPSNIVDNSLALRVACGIIIEDMMSQTNVKMDSGSNNISSIVGLLLLSAVGLTNLPKEVFLSDNFNRLIMVIKDTLEKRAQELRRRQPINFPDLENMAVSADETALKNLWKKNLEIIQILELKATADREEMEMLWWLNNGFSKELKKPFDDLSLISTAVYAGIEVSELAIIPPIESTFAIVRRVVEKNRRSKQSNATKTIPQWVTPRDVDTWARLTSQINEMLPYIRDFPSAFPLTWLGLRLKESRVSVGWEGEFEARTGLSKEDKFSPADIAEQVYREQIAIRSLSHLIGSKK